MTLCTQSIYPRAECLLSIKNRFFVLFVYLYDTLNVRKQIYFKLFISDSRTKAFFFWINSCINGIPQAVYHVKMRQLINTDFTPAMISHVKQYVPLHHKNISCSKFLFSIFSLQVYMFHKMCRDQRRPFIFVSTLNFVPEFLLYFA